MRRDEPAIATIIATLIGDLMPNERAVIGLIDAIGPLDGRTLATALATPAARSTAERLISMGLLRLEWPGGSATAVVRTQHGGRGLRSER